MLEGKYTFLRSFLRYTLYRVNIICVVYTREVGRYSRGGGGQDRVNVCLFNGLFCVIINTQMYFPGCLDNVSDLEGNRFLFIYIYPES